MKFPFQRYIVCYGKIYGSKIIGGGGASSHLRHLFCKIVYFMFASGLIYVCSPGVGHYSSQTRINAKAPTIRVTPPRPLLKSGLQPLGRYGTHQETISRRPEHTISPSDTRLEWLREGVLFKLDSNKCWRAKMQPLFKLFPGPLLKSGMGSLARYGNHQEIISRRLEQMYTSSDTRLEWPREGPLFESDSDKRQGARAGSLFESPPWPLLKSGLHLLFRYGTHQTISGRLEEVYLLSDRGAIILVEVE